METKNPVRVIRGYKLASPFAPEEGYRYDGMNDGLLLDVIVLINSWDRVGDTRC